ncbi:diacylglycerol kinase [Sinorhizobium medicae]|uniref:diacylglycerol kinase n=1 Tax=Sinorhizobium medicae TaxID=110321 RepID=UPI001AAD52A3|nr:diacylglycerol kinase [Sinorhizobium medicae]MBO1939115.1 diacylglycerol kinase [Sinorhizobium medicae]MBO1945007.1 diacylglycerol kinase [Sinorhizobium medicae]MDX0871267.1 diacylglycerol kinase [Sinorhizobium medicae]
MTHDTELAPPKRAGFAHLRAAAGYSIGGLKRLAKEAAFRQEALAGAGLVVAYAVMEVTAAIRLSAAVLLLLLLAMEAVNTAIEEIIDRISPEMSDTGKHAKDLGSLAVFCLISANSILLLYALAIHLTV